MRQTAVCMVFLKKFFNSHLNVRLVLLMVGVEILKLLNDFWKKLLRILVVMLNDLLQLLLVLFLAGFI